MSKKTKDVAVLVAGIIMFGALMGLHYELPSIWARAAAAGVAFGVVAGGCLLFRKGRH